jgi:hypothetical protein
MRASTTMDSNPTASCIHVTLLIRAHCGFCEDAQGILSTLAAEFPLLIETVDLDSPAGEQLALRGGVLFPPGIFLDGQPFSYGRLSERKVRRELERRHLVLMR